MMENLNNWSECKFEDILKYLQPTKHIVRSTEYDDKYLTPVLTAGKSFIKGYTDEDDGIFDNIPVIIFDDFTTASKYVNFPFKVKSSAMKILVPSSKLVDLKFIYYGMQVNQIRSDTHKRYWISVYAKKQFLIPPLNEQHRIVAKIEELFSELDKGIENLKTAQAQLKVYRQALLKHAFEGKLTAQWREQNKDKLETASALQQRIQTERVARYQQKLSNWQATDQTGSKPKAPKSLLPLTDKELAELSVLPDGWGWVKLGEVSKVGTGITPLKGRSDFYANGNIPWITSGALNNNFVTEASDYVTDLALKETNLHIYPKHTLLIALYGEGKTRGKCSELLIEATTNQAIAVIVLDGISEKLRKYIKWFFQKNYSDIRLKSSGGVQPNLNLGIIENTIFPMCSLEEATYIVDSIENKLSEIEQLDQIITTALQQSEALRQSILKKAFSGTLVAQDANDEPASVLLARIKAQTTNKQSNNRLAKDFI